MTAEPSPGDNEIKQRYRMGEQAMPAPYILHTMSLVSALDVGNWHRLFPNLGIFMVVKEKRDAKSITEYDQLMCINVA
jgi:hypothetical protein